MKATTFAAAAAALLTGVQAHHVHDIFHAKKAANDSAVCVPTCTTVYYTITGDYIWTPTPGPLTTTQPAAVSTTPAPTPVAQTCPTSGTYTFPASTMTVTSTVTAVVGSTTPVTSGTYTVGGVTTVVSTATTVVCPYATTTTSAGVVTSIVDVTTYVCPSSGTYTIAPLTTTVTAPTTTITVPIVTTYCPGTYTAPAVTTVVTTSTVVYCPYSQVVTPAPAAAAPTAAPAPPAPAPAASAPAAASPPATLGGSGKQWAITYTPYAPSNGACKSAAEVLSDVQAIAAAGFTTLRVYSTDCDTLPNVGAAAAATGMKIIAGVFIGQPGCGDNPNVAAQISALKSWARWDLVEMVAVGNEALFNGYCTAQQLADLISSTKSQLGYTGPYTTTDTVAGWQGNGVASIVCPAVDFPAANIHAYFNSETAPADAGSFVQSQLAIVESLCGKSGVVLESGYPKQGNCNGLNCPSKANQETALSAIQNTLGSKVVFFSLFDDLWKGAGDCGCETSFGCASLFGVN